jgi:cytidyltransferase-like protein
MKNAIVMIGRFQPFHRGHMCIAQKIKRNFPDHELIIAVVERKADRCDERSPWPSRFIIRTIREVLSVYVMEVFNAHPVYILDQWEHTKRNYDILVCGPDRQDAYEAMIATTDHQIQVHTMDEIPNIRATTVREVVHYNDAYAFEHLMPRNLGKSFKMYQDEMETEVSWIT